MKGPLCFELGLDFCLAGARYGVQGLDARTTLSALRMGGIGCTEYLRVLGLAQGFIS